MSEMKLDRVLGLPAVSFIAVGFMIGGGVFVFTGIALEIAGPALPLAYALAAIPVFISMMPLAMLGAALPCTGASYRVPSRLVSPGLAFVGVWVYALAAFFGQIPLYALGCARYAQTLWPGLSPVLAALVIVTAIYVVNVLGVRLAALVQGALVVTLLGALLFYVVRGTAELDPVHFEGILRPSGGKLLLATALLAFTYFGANGILELGGEIVRPGVVIPRAFWIAFPVVATIYVAVALATVGAAPAADLLAADEPLVLVAERTCGTVGFRVFVLAGAVLALLTTLHALFLVGTRALMVLVDDGLLPAALGRLHPRFRTPHRLLTAVWALSILGIASGLELETLASYAALGGLIIFLPLQIAALRLPRALPDEYRASEFKLRGVWLWICSGVGVLMVLLFGAVILIDLGTPAKIGAFAAFVVSGIVCYAVRVRQLRALGRAPARLRPGERWADQGGRLPSP